MTTTRTFTASNGETATLNRNAVPEFALLVRKGDKPLWVHVAGKLKSCETEARQLLKANERHPHVAPFICEIVPYMD